MKARKSDGWGTSAIPLLCGEKMESYIYRTYILTKLHSSYCRNRTSVFLGPAIDGTCKNTWVSLVRNSCSGHRFHRSLFPGLRRMDLLTIFLGFTDSQKKPGCHTRPAKRYKKQQGVHVPMSPNRSWSGALSSAVTFETPPCQLTSHLTR